MALSTPTSVDYSEEDATFWVSFAAQYALLQQRRIRERNIFIEAEKLNAERRSAERRCKRVMAICARLCSRDRRLWSYPRGPSWWETTQPHLSDDDFRGNFRMSRTTFTYVVSVCESMRRVDTNKRQAIPLEKRIAIGIYRLASSAEDRTVANAFGVSRASVNIIFREFCEVVVRHLEPRFVRFPTLHELAEHMRQFAALTGFPQGVGALDGCHIEVCPPKEQACDYYNYKGSGCLFFVQFKQLLQNRGGRPLPPRAVFGSLIPGNILCVRVVAPAGAATLRDRAAAAAALARILVRACCSMVGVVPGGQHL
ncbi:hypothetical protein HPB50_018598 [Hyalomma asiaticum]|uniref:Uncharacterized protein n=1 Tax=Hyalomma asiaticum TaxID=266040 RepID=A0ACB7SJB7_HYAAI|nr:hypothetical protein HPB50_018598 [Hyalomma asiaticum]